MASPCRRAIAEAWLAKALDSYAPPTARFLREERDPFRNPVGHALAECIPALLDQLLGPMDPAVVTPLLDRIVRIRAVQEASSQKALAIVAALRPALVEARGRGVEPAALAAADAPGDDLMNRAIDLYIRCRLELDEIRAREAGRRTRVLDRMAARRGGDAA
jgi:hypothetical protein